MAFIKSVSVAFIAVLGVMPLVSAQDDLTCLSENIAALNQWLADEQAQDYGSYEILRYSAQYDEASSLNMALLINGGSSPCDANADTLLAQAALSDAVLLLSASPTFVPTSAPTPPTFAPTFAPTLVPTAPCGSGAPCSEVAIGTFCNYDSVDPVNPAGVCVSCPLEASLDSCDVDVSGLTSAGSNDCKEQCLVLGASFEDDEDLAVGLGVGIGGGSALLFAGLLFCCIKQGALVKEDVKGEKGTELTANENFGDATVIQPGYPVGQMEIHVDDNLPASTV